MGSNAETELKKYNKFLNNTYRNAELY